MAINAVEMEEEATLREALLRHWGMRSVRMQPLASGHTNKSFLVDDGAREWVLRQSWAGKTRGQVEDEARVLAHLREATSLTALPSPVATRDGHAAVHDGKRWLHLFACLAGAPGSAPHTVTVEDAMRVLGTLHQALSTLPIRDVEPLAWLHQRLARVRSRPAPALPQALAGKLNLLLARIQAQLDTAETWPLAPTQWLHGDYHAGNLLQVAGRVQAVLDFDDAGQGSPSIEAAFALFALTRDAAAEDKLVFDAPAWDAGLAAYAAACPRVDVSSLRVRRDALSRLFCADQSLIHLEAAQRGLWTLGPGIGFLAGCRQLLAPP